MKVFEHIDKRIAWLQKHLIQAIENPPLTYKEICKINKVGLYFIYLENTEGDMEFQYIGQTTRSTKRMRELATDFRSHSFNRKLLAQRFREKEIVVHVLSNTSKKQLLESGILTLEAFKRDQKSVNDAIRNTYKFKFYEYLHTDILLLEHFAISILGPLYND
ncbi:hypothetical protein HF324_29260 [Chitinophaga oryzae]|uniref:GIY-YIG domain-containing protein n=1 Tax=Chitinophaga oryzae TaxID=2725414 RepID=A0ABX6LNI1_9BACT|nr:hypothetical protein [Chitinophaga oryzae]QJB41715.1 hypothetical protein HF324_29260 [Chitinophaga oryzae]